VNRAPTIRLLSAKRVGAKVYARFRVCDDSSGRISVIARETKKGLSGRHKLTANGCATFARNWRVVPYFRTGAIRVSLTPTDRSGKTGRTVSRAVR
jgi:hypothetical protein